MRRALPALLAFATLAATTACAPPREQVYGRSADGGTAVELDLAPTSGDSVRGTGTVRVGGRPHAVVLRGRWNEQADGLRRLAATLQSDTIPGERWTLEWSPVSLDGSLRPGEGRAARSVALATLD